MENFWACIVVSAITSFIVNLALAKHARDRVSAAQPRAPKEKKVISIVPPRLSEPVPENRAQLRQALLGLGWRATEIDKCIAAFGPRVDREPLPGLVKEAIGRLAS
jgi:hypothetical protein